MAKRKSASFLPKFLQTDKNKKFLHGTLDPTPPNSKSLERIDGYVGLRFGPVIVRKILHFSRSI